MSFPMCIQVSAAVHKAWPDGHNQLQQLSAREVKGKGQMTTFLLKVFKYCLLPVVARCWR